MSKKNPLDDPQNKAKIEQFLIEHAPLLNMHYKKLVDTGKIPKDLDNPTDIHMAGFEGLMDAIHKYDPKHGASFATYAGHRIRGKMLDHVVENGLLPKTAMDDASNLRHTQKNLRAAALVNQDPKMNVGQARRAVNGVDHMLKIPKKPGQS